MDNEERRNETTDDDTKQDDDDAETLGIEANSIAATFMPIQDDDDTRPSPKKGGIFPPRPRLLERAEPKPIHDVPSYLHPIAGGPYSIIVCCIPMPSYTPSSSISPSFISGQATT
jgi:hypothetical protein